MIKQIITIHRKKYATGLFWQPVNPGVTPYIYARQLINKSNKKYSLLTEYKTMIGLTDSRAGVKAGMAVAAPEIMNAFSGFISFLGVFETDTHNFYLIAVRNGIILRDVLIESETDARKAYAELSNMPDWNGLFAPSGWGMPRSQEKFLSEIVRKSSAVAKLRQISIVKSLTPSIALIVVCVLLGLLFLYKPWDFKKSVPVAKDLTPNVIAEYQRQVQKKIEEPVVKQIEKPKVIKNFPYDKLPDVLERANICYKAAGFVMQPIAGWRQQSLKCDDKYISVRFMRDFGTLNDFYEVGANVMPGGIVTQTSERDISVRAKLPEVATSKSFEERSQDMVVRDLYSIFQQMNMRVSIRPTSITVKNGEEKDIVKVIELNASSKLIPYEFMQIFNDFSGVYMKSVEWNANNRTWDYKIVIYTK